jgi:hypothetical protein
LRDLSPQALEGNHAMALDTLDRAVFHGYCKVTYTCVYKCHPEGSVAMVPRTRVALEPHAAVRVDGRVERATPTGR